MKESIFLLFMCFFIVGVFVPKSAIALTVDIEDKSIFDKMKGYLALGNHKPCTNTSTGMPLPELFQNIDRIVVYLNYSIDENSPLFPTQERMEENILSILISDFGSCVRPDKISFANSVDDPAFQKNGTLGVYARIAYKAHIKTLYMTSFLYRHDRTDFTSRIGESHYWQKRVIHIQDEGTAGKSIADFLRYMSYVK